MKREKEDPIFLLNKREGIHPSIENQRKIRMIFQQADDIFSFFQSKNAAV